MIAQLRQLRERAGNTRERTRQIVLALFALGLIYLLSGARPLLLAAIVIVLIFAARHVARPAAVRRARPAPASLGGLDYEQTLEELLGMVGREVIVLLALGRGTPPGLADLQGTSAERRARRRSLPAHRRALPRRGGPLRRGRRLGVLGASPGLRQRAARRPGRPGRRRARRRRVCASRSLTTRRRG